jgi:hypothetical protein
VKLANSQRGSIFSLACVNFSHRSMSVAAKYTIAGAHALGAARSFQVPWHFAAYLIDLPDIQTLLVPLGLSSLGRCKGRYDRTWRPSSKHLQRAAGKRDSSGNNRAGFLPR